ncbi:hypothetical protein C8R46DRAFT_1227470 [Mycena filopes]|nr:hypothetical protein C8R46DRAFT_1227470 [Mycena filopes]
MLATLASSPSSPGFGGAFPHHANGYNQPGPSSSSYNAADDRDAGYDSGGYASPYGVDSDVDSDTEAAAPPPLPVFRNGDDVLRARLKTVGVSEYTFEMEVSTGRETGTEWRIVDVGGSRSQRVAVDVDLPRLLILPWDF